MTFLTPAAGILGAAIALPILVSLYLLKLRRRTLQVSTTILWEQAAQDLQANVPLRWIRPSWLLALQLLAVASVLAALARPAVPSAGSNAGVSRIVLLIDRSAPMAAADALSGKSSSSPPGGETLPLTRLDQAKREALRIIEESARSSGDDRDAPGRRPEVMVIAYAAEARVVAGFTSNSADLRKAVLALKTADQPDDLPRALALLRAMDAGVSNEEERRIRTSVVVLSDAPIDPVGLAGELPSGAVASLVRVGPGGASQASNFADNLGIVALSALRETENPSTVRVFVRVINAGPAEVRTAISCRVDDRPAGLSVLNIPEARAAADGTVEPGSASTAFTVENAGGGLLCVSIPRPDLLATDNQAALVLVPATKARVLLVGPGDESSDPFHAARGTHGIDRFLLSALENLDLGSLQVIDARTYDTRYGQDGGSHQSAQTDLDLIIFDRTEPRIAPPVPTISIGSGLRSMGIRVEPIPEGQRGSEPTRVAIWNRTHPVLRYAPLDSLLISPPMRITPPDSVSSTAQARSGTSFLTLAEGATGPLIVIADDDAAPGGNDAGRTRRLFLGFDLLRTNWGPDVSFPVFIASAVEHLTGRGDAAAGRAFTTVQNISVLPHAGVASIKVSGPREFEVAVPQGEDSGGTVAPSIALGALETAGVYRAEGARRGDAVIAVNLLSERASLLSMSASPGAPVRSDQGELPPPPPTAASSKPARASEQPRREIWHWFITAAAALSSIEWIVYALRARM